MGKLTVFFFSYQTYFDSLTCKEGETNNCFFLVQFDSCQKYFDSYNFRNSKKKTATVGCILLAVIIVKFETNYCFYEMTSVKINLTVRPVEIIWI